MGKVKHWESFPFVVAAEQDNPPLCKLGHITANQNFPLISDIKITA